ncbi:hypothetical protein GGF43_000281 [Coemansia sp. RSA 2618]|nr:hypothetical protein GGF43_000281 [Coemansia sp. RSA 2618]
MASTSSTEAEGAAHPGMGKTQEFEYQVAGHPGVLVVEGNEMIIKPLNRREQQFYEGANQSTDFKTFMPQYYGTLERAEPGSDPADVKEFICLENLVHGFEKPCVMDFKIGSQLYDIDATPEKRERMEQKAERTTSKRLGFVVTGMKVFGRPSAERDWCRGLTEETIVAAISQYFSAAEEHVSARYRDYLIWQFVVEVTELLEVVQQAECRMYSSSVLFVYDASKVKYERMFPNEGADSDGRKIRGFADRDSDGEENAADDSLLDMKAIDFAHSHWVPGQGPDEKYVAGLKKLIEVLQSLLS